MNDLLKKSIRMIIKEALDDAIEEEVQEIMSQPEYSSVESLADFKFDNDETSFSVAEAHAIARNMTQKNERNYKVVEASDLLVKDIINQLKSYGLSFVPLQPLKSVRGFTSPKNGSNRFAGNAGGSGFGMEGFTSYGGGAGAIGSKTAWSATAKGSLPMGSKRK